MHAVLSFGCAVAFVLAVVSGIRYHDSQTVHQSVFWCVAFVALTVATAVIFIGAIVAAA